MANLMLTDFVAREPRNALPDGWNSLPVAHGINRLTTIFALQRELMRTQASWMAGVPYWDAKLEIAGHILTAASHGEALLKRLHELKATSAEHRQIIGLETFVRDVASAGSGDEWLHGLYRAVKPWLVRQWEDYLRASDPVMDAPSQAILHRMIEDVRHEIAWFKRFHPTFSAWEQPDVSEWTRYLSAYLEHTSLAENGLVAAPARAARPGARPDFDGVARVRRDATFRVVAKSDFPREGTTFEEKRFLVFYNHTQEMQFAESLGAILYETSEMPWAFHHDLARHMADEVRHARMGQTRLEQLGVNLTEVPMQTQHYEFRSNLDPLERFCLMTLVMEATAFERKRAHVELFEANNDRVSALYETYDIRDEMLHTNLGHVWVPILLRVYHDSRSVSEMVEHCRAVIAQVITEYPASAANMLKK